MIRASTVFLKLVSWQKCSNYCLFPWTCRVPQTCIICSIAYTLRSISEHDGLCSQKNNQWNPRNKNHIYHFALIYKALYRLPQRSACNDSTVRWGLIFQVHVLNGIELLMQILTIEMIIITHLGRVARNASERGYRKLLCCTFPTQHEAKIYAAPAWIHFSWTRSVACGTMILISIEQIFKNRQFD